MRRAVALASTVLLLLVALSGVGRTEEADLESLRDRLLAAGTRSAVDQALEALAARIGREPGFADATAFADYLGRLPRKAAEHPRVRLRRGWAYLAAGRGAAAVAVLEEVAKAGGEDAPVALAYLGEAARLGGELDRAMDLLTAAAADAEAALQPFLVESAHKTAFQIRQRKPAKEFEGLPDYVPALEDVLGSLDHPTLRGITARWLLDDYGAYAVPGRDRAKAWASAAARHALAALREDGYLAGGDGAKLAADAAAALEPEDRATDRRTMRFDLLAWAYQLGRRPDDDTHAMPAVVALLAEAALVEERYVLAGRLARERLDISDSPAARRVLAALPPDLGE